LPFGTDLKDLLSFAESFALRPLDRTRPLWESVLVDNLDGGRAAYILKFHHSLTDGVGATQLLSSVQSRTREPTPDKPLPQRPDGADGPSDAWRLTVNEVADQLTGLPDATHSAVTMGVNALIRPASAASGALRYAASLRRVLTPVAAPPSPLLSDRTGRKWRFAALDYSLERLRAAAKSAGGSVNDAFVASLLGGLRRYHEIHDTFLDQIPMAMPVSMRKTDDPMGGNKFAGAFFAAPMGLADPVERISAIRGLVQSLRGESALDTVSLVAPVLNRTPPAVGAAASRLVARADISASNFPGMTHETFIAGARVERIYPFGPLPGVAIMATMTSHAGVCCIGLNIDGSAVSDCDVLVTCLSAGFDEVLSISETSPRS
jgi:diacylglycerol O-acyltransferase